MDRQARKKAAGRGREWLMDKFNSKGSVRVPEKTVLDGWAQDNNPLHGKKTRVKGKEKRG